MSGEISGREGKPMAGMERITWEGLSSSYIQSRFHSTLDKEPQEIDTGNELKKSLMDTHPLDEGASCANKLIYLGRKYKKVILRVPLLEKFAYRVNAKLRHIVYEQRNAKDVSHLFRLDINDFICYSYRELLSREVEEAGFLTYQRLICSGMSKEAVIYLLAKSSEFNGRFTIKNLTRYAKRYNRFVFKQRLRKIPVLGWGYSMCVNVWNLNRLATSINIMDADRRFREERMSAQLEILMYKQNEYVKEIKVLQDMVQAQGCLSQNEIKQQKKQPSQEMRKDIRVKD